MALDRDRDRTRDDISISSRNIGVREAACDPQRALARKYSRGQQAIYEQQDPDTWRYEILAACVARRYRFVPRDTSPQNSKLLLGSRCRASSREIREQISRVRGNIRSRRTERREIKSFDSSSGYSLAMLVATCGSRDISRYCCESARCMKLSSPR